MNISKEKTETLVRAVVGMKPNITHVNLQESYSDCPFCYERVDDKHTMAEIIHTWDCPYLIAVNLLEEIKNKSNS
jgi:hypothetical protein